MRVSVCDRKMWERHTHRQTDRKTENYKCCWLSVITCVRVRVRVRVIGREPENGHCSVTDNVNMCKCISVRVWVCAYFWECMGVCVCVRVCERERIGACKCVLKPKVKKVKKNSRASAFEKKNEKLWIGEKVEATIFFSIEQKKWKPGQETEKVTKLFRFHSETFFRENDRIIGNDPD